MQVFQVREKRTGKIFAMKVMRKARILERDHSTYVRAERDILTSVVHPYIVRMRFSFQVRKLAAAVTQSHAWRLGVRATRV